MDEQTIDPEVYQAVADACSMEFAMSYLLRAQQTANVITPATTIAWERLTQNRHAMGAIRGKGCSLRKPGPLDRPRFSDQPSAA